VPTFQNGYFSRLIPYFSVNSDVDQQEMTPAIRISFMQNEKRSAQFSE